MKKRIFLVGFLLLFVSVSAYSLEWPGLEPLTNLTIIDDSLTQLEDNSLKQQKQIEDLQNSLTKLNQDLNNAITLQKNLETSLQETSLQLENVENSLKKRDIQLRVLRITVVALPVTTFISGLMIGSKMKE